MLRRRAHGRGGPQRQVIVPQPVYNKGWERIICVASGPSLTAEQGFIISSASEWKVIVVNNSWERVLMADVLYGGDQRWWVEYWRKVKEGFNGECWTGDRWAAHKYGLNFVQLYDQPGLSTQSGIAHSGGNSGYVALNLAYFFGARRIVLAGYDFQRTYGMDHWHGAHPESMGQLPLSVCASRSFDEVGDWVDRMERMAYDLDTAGVSVINASIETALGCFRRRDLVEALQCP